MKKNGFTLAELLITLGIIGVVSSLTIPALVSNNTETQIGPKLAKAVSAFEQANANLLSEKGAASLSEARLVDENDPTEYYDELSKYLKISKLGTGYYVSKDGVRYIGQPSGGIQNPDAPPHKQMIGLMAIAFDDSVIKGTFKNGYNTFHFAWMNDGTLTPRGATGWDGTSASAYGGPEHWTTKCPVGVAPTDPIYCTGHIFENDLRVLYK